MKRLLAVGLSHDVWPPLMYRISEQLAQEGWQITHIYSAQKARDRALASAADFENIVIDRPELTPTNVLGTIGAIKGAVRQYLSQGAADLVIAHHAAALPALVHCRGAQPLVYLASDLYDFNTLKPLMNRCAENHYQRYFAGAIVNNQARVDILRSRYRWRCPMVVLPNAPSIGEQPPVEADARERVLELFRRQGTEPKHVAYYAGSISDQRCVVHLVQALAQLPPEVGLLLVGFRRREADPYERSVLEEISKQGVGDRVVCLDHLRHPDMLTYTMGADVGMMLYRPDGPNTIYCAPNKLFEYAMCGVPVLCWEHPHLKDLVRGELEGECIEQITPEAISEAIGKVLARTDAGTSERLRRLFAERLCFERHWKQQRGNLLGLAGGGA